MSGFEHCWKRFQTFQCRNVTNHSSEMIDESCLTFYEVWHFLPLELSMTLWWFILKEEVKRVSSVDYCFRSHCGTLWQMMQHSTHCDGRDWRAWRMWKTQLCLSIVSEQTCDNWFLLLKKHIKHARSSFHHLFEIKSISLSEKCLNTARAHVASVCRSKVKEW